MGKASECVGEKMYEKEKARIKEEEEEENRGDVNEHPLHCLSRKVMAIHR